MDFAWISVKSLAFDHTVEASKEQRAIEKA
jgi:hypothetical protein